MDGRSPRAGWSAARIGVLLAACGAAIVSPASTRADEAWRTAPWPSAEQPAYPSSPFHGMVDGDGQVIPCRCRFQGRDYKLGEEVCMSTHAGTVLTRCDLLLNNTSWVPTTTACVVSLGPGSAPRPGAVADLPYSRRSILTIRSSTNVTR